MYQPKMALTPEQLDILSGKQGETKAKMMEVLVRYGDVFGAKRMVPLTYKTGHLVIKKGRKTSFLGCTNFPKCRYHEWLDKPKGKTESK